MMTEKGDFRPTVKIEHPSDFGNYSQSGLKDSWLAAGCVRILSGIYCQTDQVLAGTDVDVIFFNPSYSEAETMRLEAKLKADWPQYRWELRNQSYMHRHSPGTAPYKNLAKPWCVS